MITGKNFIGKKRSAKGNEKFRSFNSLLNIPTPWTFTQATAEEVEEVVQLAHKAFETYRSTSKELKALFLNTIANEIEALGEKLLLVYCEESALPIERARVERARTLFQLRSFADLVLDGSWVNASIDTAVPDRNPTPKPDIRKMSFPLGPVVIFGASNFPFAYSTAGGDTASALAAGCTVVVKSHEMHPGTGEMVSNAIIKAIKKCDLPNGVFSNVNGDGKTIGVQLVKHPLIKAVGFTGSLQGGRALFDHATQRPEPIPVFAEMGSLNPIILLPSAIENEIEKWSMQFALSISGSSGQFCTKPGLFFGIKGKSLDLFAKLLGEKLGEIQPACMLHPTISKKFKEGKATLAAQKGVQQIAAQKRKGIPNFGQQQLFKIEGADFLENSIVHQEIFGPAALVVVCKNENEMLQIIKRLEGQLTGSILGDEQSFSKYSKLTQALQDRVGRLIFNGVPTGVEVCPSMVHGGPYPASSDSRFTSVGTQSIQRWVRPIAFQNCPGTQLPLELQNENPLQILRLVNNIPTREGLSF